MTLISHLPAKRPARNSTEAPATLTLTAIALLLAGAGLGGCSTVTDAMSGDKIDYRSGGAKTPGLEIPPDLTQLAKDSRYQQAGGSVSAATFQGGPTAGAAATPAAAPPRRTSRRNRSAVPLSSVRATTAGSTRR